ncbi:MAG: lipopolysaccharide biosynthesis protein [Polyangiales bacterium]
MSDEAPVDAERLKRRARLGVAVLVGRTGVLQLIILAGKVYLARVLGPSEFGTFWIVQNVLAFLMVFGDAGLGASLVQKKVHPTQRELSSVWWAQVTLAVSFVAVAWLGAPLLLRFWPDLPPSGPWLLRALSLEMLLTVLRVIPAILMERELQFARLAILDVLGMGLFYLIASVLARPLGTFALVVAILGSGVIGTVIGFAMRPWRPSWVFDRSAVREALRFGIAYQTKNLVGFFNGGIIPIYGGARLGRTALGLMSWSQNIAYFPLQLVDILSRVNFPLYRRLQHDRRALSELLVRSLVVSAVVTYLFIGLFLGLGPVFVGVIYGDAWVPAVPTLYVFSAALTIGFIAPLVASAFDGLGRPSVSMRLGLFWTALNWIVVVVAMRYFHTILAFALAYTVHIVVGNALVLWVVRELVDLRALLRRLGAPLVAGAASALLGWRVLRPWVGGPWTLAAAIAASFGVYAAITLLLDRQLVTDAQRAFKPKAPEPVDEAASELVAVQVVTAAAAAPEDRLR